MSGRIVHINENVPDAIYIGRAMPRQKLKASPLQNPFTVAIHGREMAIAKYRAYLVAQVSQGDPVFINALIATRGKPLACWCRSDGIARTELNACHGDVILEALALHSDEELRKLRVYQQS